MTDWAMIADAVVGTTMSMPAIAERFDVDEDAVEDALLDLGVEVCPACGWWVNSYDMTDVDDSPLGDPACLDCAGH